MRRTLRLAACGAPWACSLVAQAPPPAPPADSGATLYAAWCARCHGADARGTPAASTRLEVPPADLAACAVSSAEPEDLWVDIVAQGGTAFGLSLDMPAYGDAATPDQLRMVVQYVRGLCRERGWPPGELNFPRPFLAAGALRSGFVVQGEVLAVWEEAEGIAGASYRLGVGREVGRFVPMIEAGWGVPREGDRALSFYPQVWVRLSRLGHVAASVGAELPAVGPEPRRPRVAAFVLWDFGDGPLFRGW